MGMLVLALSAQLHERGRNGELQSKSESKGKYPPASGSCGPRADVSHASGMQHPRSSLLPRGRGAQGGCSPRTAIRQPLHLPPRVACTFMFKCVDQALMHILPLLHQSLQGNHLATPQHNRLGVRGHMSHCSGGCRAVIYGLHITMGYYRLV